MYQVRYISIRIVHRYLSYLIWVGTVPTSYILGILFLFGCGKWCQCSFSSSTCSNFPDQPQLQQQQQQHSCISHPPHRYRVGLCASLWPCSGTRGVISRHYSRDEPLHHQVYSVRTADSRQISSSNRGRRRRRRRCRSIRYGWVDE